MNSNKLDFSTLLVATKPDTDVLSYVRDRRLYWADDAREDQLGMYTGVPFCNVINFLEPGNVITVVEYHCRWFSMDEEVDRNTYCLVNQRAAMGWYVISFTERKFEKANCRVWLEWRQVYAKWVPKNDTYYRSSATNESRDDT